MQLFDWLTLADDHLVVAPLARLVREVSLHVHQLRPRQLLKTRNVANDVDTLLYEVHLLLTHQLERVLVDACKVAISYALYSGRAHLVVD